MKRKLMIVYVNVTAVLMLLLAAEVVGQVAYRMRHGHALGVSQVFELHPFLAARAIPGVRAEADGTTVTIDAEGRRWTGAPAPSAGTIRVAVLGGSTSFGTGVSDEESWPALLQRQLGPRYAVMNYGVPGYSTAEAIIQAGLVLPETAPAVVVYYEGWNDLRNYHDRDLGPDYFTHGLNQYESLEIPAPFTRHRPLVSRLADVSSVFRLARSVARRLRAHGSGEVLHTPDPFVDRIYLRNLSTLRVLARHIGAKALFVPQVLNDAEFVGKHTSRLWTPHVEDDALPGLMRAFNAIMERACEPGAEDCAVLGAVQTRNWQPEDFVDEGHFSAIGGARFADLVATRIRELTPGS